MKVGKPTGKQVSDGLATAGGVITGMKASKAAAEIIPVQNATVKRAAIVLVGAALAVGVKGSGTGATIVKGAGMGMIAQQAGEIIDEAVSGKLPDNAAIKAAFGSKTESVEQAKAALAAFRRSRSLGNPADTSMFQLGNAAERAYPSDGSYIMG